MDSISRVPFANNEKDSLHHTSDLILTFYWLLSLFDGSKFLVISVAIR